MGLQPGSSASYLDKENKDKAYMRLSQMVAHMSHEALLSERKFRHIWYNVALQFMLLTTPGLYFVLYHFLLSLSDVFKL